MTWLQYLGLFAGVFFVVLGAVAIIIGLICLTILLVEPPPKTSKLLQGILTVILIGAAIIALNVMLLLS